MNINNICYNNLQHFDGSIVLNQLKFDFTVLTL